MAAIACLRSDRRVLAVVFLALAGLTKETHLLFAVGASAWLALRGDRRWAAIALGAPVATFLAWMAWLAAHTPPGGTGLWNLGWP
ncbi:MAG: hypothetical protein GTN89_07245, partial [Acidobacteria bacterium]|nr:hypothetical protein [Acidobacteriota bacterium]